MGRLHAHPLLLYLPSRQSGSVRSSWEGRYTHTFSSLILMYSVIKTTHLFTGLKQSLWSFKNGYFGKSPYYLINYFLNPGLNTVWLGSHALFLKTYKQLKVKNTVACIPSQLYWMVYEHNCDLWKHFRNVRKIGLNCHITKRVWKTFPTYCGREENCVL